MKNLKATHLSIYLLTLCVSFVLYSCKKEKKLNLKIEEVILPEPIEKDTPEIDITEPDPIEKGKYIPIKIEGTGLSLNLKYKDNTALLTEISDGNNNKTVITYTATQLPQKLEKYSAGKLSYIVYYEQADKKITNKGMTFTHKEKPANSTPTGSYTLSYNEHQKISSVNYYNNANTSINTNTCSYTEFLNLSEMSTTEPVNSIIYTYDQKSGISSHILNSDLFALEAEHWFLRCNNNNLLTVLNQKSPEQNVNISYEYNESDYPSKMTLTNNKGKQTLMISYQRLQQ